VKPEVEAERLRQTNFADFYRLRREPIYRALAMTLRDEDIAADAVEEAMARAYERWRSSRRLRRGALPILEGQRWWLQVVSGTGQIEELWILEVDGDRILVRARISLRYRLKTEPSCNRS